MSRRAKVAANSPYATTNSDARTFPATTGEPLEAVDYIALADDIAALAARQNSGYIADLTDSAFYEIDNGGSPVTPDFAAATCKWAKHGKIVLAHFYFEMTSSMTFTYFRAILADLVAAGLPEPDPDGLWLADVLIEGSYEFLQRHISADGLIIDPPGTIVLTGGATMRVQISYQIV
jgi:hypothetical protein